MKEDHFGLHMLILCLYIFLHVFETCMKEKKRFQKKANNHVPTFPLKQQPRWFAAPKIPQTKNKNWHGINITCMLTSNF